MVPASHFIVLANAHGNSLLLIRSRGWLIALAKYIKVVEGA